MRYKSIFTTAFLMIPFFIVSGTSAEIFELANSYDIIGENSDDIETADFNNDGLEDFIILTDSTFLTPYIGGLGWYEIFLSNGDCSFTRPGAVALDTIGIEIYHWQVITGDFNEDSNEDIIIMNLNSRLYIGDGTGAFSESNNYPWTAHNGCVGDLNNDGHLDIVGAPFDTLHHTPYPVYIYGDSVISLLGDGLGNFTEGWVYDEYPPGSSEGYSSSQLAYLDNVTTDTNLDLCVPCVGYGDGGFLIFHGTGDGCFNDSVYYEIEPYIEGGIQFSSSGDFNEDGYADIVVAGVAGMSQQSTFIFLNQQNGTFLQEGDGYFTGACDFYKIATVDLDLDGHLDLSVMGSIAGYGDGTFNDSGSGSLSSVPGADFIDMDIDGDLDLFMRWGGIYRNTTIQQGIEGESQGSMTNPVLDISPNPFSSSVSIEVSGYSTGIGNLQIFDVSGRLVTELKPVTGDGEMFFIWDGISSGGSDLPSGIYTARLRSGNVVTSATMLKLE